MTPNLTANRATGHFNRLRDLFDGTAEPLGFEAGDANLQRYVGNDPTNRIDPTGLVPENPSIREEAEEIARQQMVVEEMLENARMWMQANLALARGHNTTPATHPMNPPTEHQIQLFNTAIRDQMTQMSIEQMEQIQANLDIAIETAQREMLRDISNRQRLELLRLLGRARFAVRQAMIEAIIAAQRQQQDEQERLQQQNQWPYNVSW